MTDFNLDNVELKSANITAVVGDKQVSATVADKAEVDKYAELMAELAKNPNISDIKVTEGNDETPAN